MTDYKKEFIEFMVRSGVLTFGDFTAKSGRKTPFLSTREITKRECRRQSWASFMPSASWRM